MNPIILTKENSKENGLINNPFSQIFIPLSISSNSLTQKQSKLQNQVPFLIDIINRIVIKYDYINYLTTNLLLRKMHTEKGLDLSTQFPQVPISDHYLTLGQLDHQDSWMDQYFNEQVFEPKISHEAQVSKILEEYKTQPTLITENQSTNQDVHTQKRRNKSLFHNFQKHLLTLLKKVINVKKSELSHLPCGNRAYDLWKMFLSLKSSSKKNLYIIFGIAQRENQSNLRKTAENIPELQRLLAKYGLKQIEQGQDVLRRTVCRQARLLQKKRIECECKMKKIGEFYAYFLGFVEELQEGVISRRMTKQRKIRLIKMQQGKQ